MKCHVEVDQGLPFCSIVGIPLPTYLLLDQDAEEALVLASVYFTK